MEDGHAAAAGGGGSSSSSTSAASAASSAAAAEAAAVNTNPPGARASQDAPMRKLTTGLLATYKAINFRYYEKKKARAAAGGKADAGSSDYVMVVGQVLGGRYRVLESIGKGSFGQVVAAEDTKEGPHLGRKVAVKVIKAKEAFRKQAKMEIKLLEMLNQKDPEDQWCIGAWGGGRAAALTGLSLSHSSLLTPSRPPTSLPPARTTPQCASWSTLTTMATRAWCLSTCPSTCTTCCGAPSSRA